MEPEPEPEQLPLRVELSAHDHALQDEEEEYQRSQRAETERALAQLDGLQAEREAEDQAHLKKIRERLRTPTERLLVQLVPTPPRATRGGVAAAAVTSEARQRTVDLLDKIDDLKSDVAFLDRELGWDAAKYESAEDAARNARIRLDAEARAAQRAAAAARLKAEQEAEQEAEAAVQAAAAAAAAARAAALREEAEAARQAEAVAAAEAARIAAAEAARLARLAGGLDGHHERWRGGTCGLATPCFPETFLKQIACGRSWRERLRRRYPAFVPPAQDKGRHSEYTSTPRLSLICRALSDRLPVFPQVRALFQKEDDEFLAAQREETAKTLGE